MSAQAGMANWQAVKECAGSDAAVVSGSSKRLSACDAMAAQVPPALLACRPKPPAEQRTRRVMRKSQTSPTSDQALHGDQREWQPSKTAISKVCLTCSEVRYCMLFRSSLRLPNGLLCP